MDKIFKHIEQLAKIPSIHPNEEPVRKYIIEQLESMGKKYKIDAIGNLYLIPEKKSKVLLSAHMDKQADPYYKDLKTHIQGKLDDAVGIGIILALADHHEFYSFFTIGEELRQIGSNFALDRGLIPKVKKVIVIDTSPKKKMEKGPVFYTSFLDIHPYDNYIAEINNIAKSLGINLQPMPGAINDGIVLIQAIRNTIALEPHIDNYHSSMELCSKKDVIDTYRIIESFLINK